MKTNFLLSGMWRRQYAYLLCAFVLFITCQASAQVVTLGVPTGSGSANVLLATSTTTNNYSKTISIYNAREIHEAGGWAGTISRLWWNKEGTGEYNFGDGEIRIWLRHITDSLWAVPPDWDTEVQTAYQVFSNNTYNIPIGDGWLEVPFQNNFQWDGVRNIAVFVEWYKPSRLASDIRWVRSTTEQANATRVGSSLPLSPLLVNSNRPLLRLEIDRQTTGNNAGINKLIAPVNFCGGLNAVSVEVINAGRNVINNVQIHWEMDGQPQPTVNYTIPIDTFQRATVTLGNYNFSAAPVLLKAYTSLPNGVADTVTNNDTLTAIIRSPMFGVYTVDAGAPTSGTNFQSFTDLADALNRVGICGPVTVNVAPGSGPYNEVIYFDDISGTSPVNTIRINGNGNRVEYTNTTTAGQRQLLTLSGTKYMRIDSLEFKTLGTLGWGTLITAGALYDSITNCVYDLTSITSTSAANSVGICFSNSVSSPTGSGQNGSKCYISGNRFIGTTGTGGYYYGVNVAAGGNDSNVIVHNTFENFYYYGINISGGTGTLIADNDLHRSSKTTVTTCYGIITAGDVPGTRIINNRIHDPVALTSSGTSAFHGIRLTGNGTTVNPVLVANNIIYNINQGGAAYGIYLNAAEENRVYHNTIAFNIAYAGTGENAGIYATGNCAGLDVRNNLISITGGGQQAKYGFYYNNANSIANAQRNNFYINSTQTGNTYYGYYDGTAYNTYPDFQVVYPAFEISSLTVDPMFVNPAAGDMMPMNPALRGNGEDLTAVVPEDIMGTPRNAFSTPGAFEMPFVAGANAGLVAKITPVSQFCAGPQTISVSVINSGTSQITSMEIHWMLNGTMQTPYIYNGLLDTNGSASGNIDTVVLGTVPLLPGSNELKAWTVLVNDINNTDDTLNTLLIPSLSGTYTVDSRAPTSGTNFQTFTDLTSILNVHGVCGPVTIDVAAGSGPYNENIIFEGIPGVSPVNTIRINGNGNTVTYNTTTAAGQRQMLTLSGVSYMRIDSLEFKTLGTAGWGALITSGSRYDSITNCRFDLTSLTATTAANGTGIAFSASISSATTAGVNGTHCYIAGNHILGSEETGGPYYGINIAAGGSDSNIITNNVLENFYYYGMYINEAIATEVSNNDIHRAGKKRVTICYGIGTAGILPGTRIMNNRIHDPIVRDSSSTSSFNGIRLTGNGTVSDPVLVYNNVIYNINQGGASYGIYLSAAEENRVYHNTVAFNLPYGGTGANYGIYATGTTPGLEIMNNIVSITAGSGGTKYGFYYNTASMIADAQRNNIYVQSSQAGTQYYGYYTKAYPTYTDFQTDYPLLEDRSLIVDPAFANPGAGDFLPGNNALQGNGANLYAYVSTDITGIMRSPTPTPGAYEIALPQGYNAGMEAILNPDKLFCAGRHEVKVVVHNAGTLPINNMTIHWSLNGNAQTPYAYSGLLDIPGSATGNMDTVTLGVLIIPHGANELRVWTVIANDISTANDTITRTVTPSVFTLAAVTDTVCLGGDALLTLTPFSGYDYGMISWERSANGSSFAAIPNTDTVTLQDAGVGNDSWYRVRISSGLDGCYSDTVSVKVEDIRLTGLDSAVICGPGTATLTAAASSGGVRVNWYDSASGGSLLGTGYTFTTPVVTASTTFYAAAITGNGGLDTVGPVTPAGVGSGGYATTATYLVYFTVDAATILRSVDVFPNSTSLNKDGAIEIYDANTSALLASVPFTVTTGGSTSSGQTVHINRRLQPGDYYMKLANSNVSLYRNTAGSSFPYIGRDITITRHSYTSSQYYFYFYNWKTGTGCEGPREAVNVHVKIPPAINVQASETEVCAGDTVWLDASSSNQDYVYNWIPGNLKGNTVAVVPAAQTTYYVTASDNSGGTHDGCTITDSVRIAVRPLPAAAITTNGQTEFCKGETVSLIASSGTGYTYQWYVNGTPIPSGTNHTYTADSSGNYTVSITGPNQCSALSQVVTVTVHPLPEPVIIADGNSMQTGVYAQYQWRRNGVPIPGANQRVYEPVDSGSYSVTVTDENGCVGTSDPVPYRVGIAGVADMQEIQVYPNPAFDFVHVVSPVAFRAMIYSPDGKLVFDGINVSRIPVGDLPDGVYLLRIHDMQGMVIRTERVNKTER